MKRKLIALILAVITVLGTIPAMVYGQVIDKFENDQHWNIIKFDNNSTGEAIYNGFVENTDVTVDDDKLIKPYSSDTVMLLEKSEVFTYMSYNWGVQAVGTNDYQYISQYGTLMTNRNFGSISDADKANVNALCYATGVAFDPTGCGRKNYIAVFGYYNGSNVDKSAAYLYIFNGDTSELVESREIDKGKFKWMYANYTTLDLDNVDATNIFKITAGDYNGDGKDSLVIYDGCANQEYAFYQYDMGATTPLTGIKLSSDGYLNNGWKTAWKGDDGSILNSAGYGHMNRHLNVCMESGDINGDGIDDLAVVSCTGGLSESEAGGSISLVTTTISVGFGKKKHLL